MKTAYRCDGCVHQMEQCRKEPSLCINYVPTASFLKRREESLKEALNGK